MTEMRTQRSIRVENTIPPELEKVIEQDGELEVEETPRNSVCSLDCFDVAADREIQDRFHRE